MACRSPNDGRTAPARTESIGAIEVFGFWVLFESLVIGVSWFCSADNFQIELGTARGGGFSFMRSGASRQRSGQGTTGYDAVS